MYDLLSYLLLGTYTGSANFALAQFYSPSGEIEAQIEVPIKHVRTKFTLVLLVHL